MSVTEEVSHPPMSWLKANASANMPCMLVTEEVSHPLMSWLKAFASENMPYMLSDRRGIPSSDVSVKYTGISKHLFHGSHLRQVGAVRSCHDKIFGAKESCFHGGPCTCSPLVDGGYFGFPTRC